MGKLLKRDEVEPKDKWDIESVYNNIELYNKDYKLVDNNIEKLKSMENTFLNNIDTFKKFLLLDTDTNRLIEKLYTYAARKYDEDTGNTIYQELYLKISNLYAKYEENTSFVVPKILEQESSLINEYIEKDSVVAKYKHKLLNILRYKKYTLSPVEEKIVAAYSKVVNKSNDTADFLMDTDMKFGTIKDENNEDVSLNSSNYSTYIKSFNRNVRKEVFTKYHQTFGNFKNTLTSTLATITEACSVDAKLRGFSSSLEASLYNDNLNPSLYNNLIKVVHNNLDSLYKYYDIKKEMLNLDQFHIYDSYVTTVKNIDKKYSFEEAEVLVKEALKVLPSEYVEKLDIAFKDGYIDKYPNINKRSGAYSGGSYDTKPFVLLNYTEDYNDVSTLAHELGHSMHTYFSNQYNDYINSSYPIFLAEIASTVNELLLSYYMESIATSKDEKLFILNERLDLYKATIFRQTMFAEFEKYIHDLTDKGEVLTSDNICNYYLELNKLYYGLNVVVDDDIKYEALRIPHFYTPFYVYKYAVGLSIASYIVKNILNNKDFSLKYIEFLKSGGRDYPLEVLKIIDIDLEDTKIFEDAMNIFKDTLDKFSSINS